MKIAIFADNFFPELSGISDSLSEMARGFEKKGYQVQIYAPLYTKKEFDIVNLPEKEVDLGDNVSVIRLFSFAYKNSPTRQSRIALLSLKPFFNLRKFQPDIIHVHSPFATCLSGVLAAKLLGVPLIGTNHTIVSEFAYFFPFWQNFLAKLMSQYDAWFYNRCAFVSTPSKIVWNEMKKYGFKAKSAVISNPISSLFFSSKISNAEKEQLKKQFVLSSQTLVFAGALAVHKKVNILLQAVAIAVKVMPNVCLAIAGDGADLVKLQALALSLGIEKNVRFLGKLSQKNLAQLFRASEVFVLASSSETQNMALLQSQASAIPAICVNARALPEYVFDGENGRIVAVDNPQDFADAIISLFKNAEQREAMGQTAKQYAQKFSAEEIISQWEKVYENQLTQK